MQPRRLHPWIVFLLSCVASAGALAQQAQQPSLSELEIADKLRIALQRMPYYGPFDLIGFEVHGTVVTLNGWVYQAINRDEAEEAAKKVPGVTQVVNNIQVLPVSISDDQIRWKVFRAIYSDDFLQKYGTPIFGIDGSRWGRRFWGGRGFRRGFGSFPGSEPIGNYAIHIIVKGGQVGLYGTVNSDVDRARAEQAARSVFGVLGVDNQLQVVKD